MSECKETDEDAACFKQQVEQPDPQQAHLGGNHQGQRGINEMCQFFKKTQFLM